jgi:patatin-like phospholipase/acyl hydrolase
MNILSLDGGGARGLITLLILKEILKQAQDQTGQQLQIADLFDFYCGSSIGTVIIAGLLTPHPDQPGRPKYTVDDLISKIRNGATQMFSVSTYQNMISLWGLRSPKYYDDKRPQIFSDLFGDLKFKQLLKPVMFPCGDDLNDCPIYFQNNLPCHEEFAVADILLGTTAAPTYFPSKPINVDGRPCNLIDSGCVVNDTSALAFMEACSLNNGSCGHLYETSIGTGKSINSVNSHGWGLLEWMPNILTSFMSLATSNDQYEMSLVTKPEQRDRLNPTIPTEINYLDRPEYLDQYTTITLQWLEDNKDQIKSVVHRLLTQKGLIN